MDLQHINIKLFVDRPETVDLERFGGVFNTWIQERATAELLVDVADYRHVYAGPGVILIGHEANYSLDEADNRLGLLYNRKAHVNGSVQDKLRQAVEATLLAARKLTLEESLQFKTNEILVSINDRLLAPNTPDFFISVEADLRAFLGRLFGADAFTLIHHADPRSRFSVSATTSQPSTLQALLQNVAPESVGA